MKAAVFLPALLLPALLSVRPAPPAAQEVARTQAPVTVFLLRHAETETSTESTRDPALSEKGVKRAEALAHLLARAGVTHLFASEYQRTQATLGPLAKAVGVSVQVIPGREPEQQVAALRALPAGSVAVVAGHSNTVPGMVKALGGELAGLTEHPTHGPMLGGEEYDRMVLISLAGAEAGVKAVELRYGD